MQIMATNLFNGTHVSQNLFQNKKINKKIKENKYLKCFENFQKNIK